MDSEEANKFINSLVKNLQVLCHGHVNFSNSIQVIGHLYLNVDSDVNIDYIVNEKVCKSDTSSTVFVSKSYYSEPLKNPSEKVKFNKESQNTPSIRAVVSSDINNTRMKRNQQSNRTDSNIKSEDEFQVTKQPRMSHSCSPKIRARLPATPSGSSANNQSEKKLSRLTPANVNIFDLSSVKEEPRDEDHDKSNWSFYFEQQHPSILPHGSADELSNNFVAGLRDKSLGLYPVALHPSEVNTSFGNSSQSFLQSPSDEPGGSQSFQQSSIDVQSIPTAIESIFNNPTRQAYSVARKKYICRYREANPDVSILKVAAHFKSKYGTDISYGTLVGILRNKEKWMSVPDNQMYSMKCKVPNK